MLAMQYSFVLPADYDMTIIDRRIRDKGPMLDHFPKLRFKAYLSARQKGGEVASAENLYAPFYLWDHPDGLSNFITGPGFAALARNFGRPRVAMWVVWHAELSADLSQARYASREIEMITPHSDLSALRAAAAEAATDNSALAHVVGFDPGDWRFLRFRLWRDPPASLNHAAQLYAVGHMSLP